MKMTRNTYQSSINDNRDLIKPLSIAYHKEDDGRKDVDVSHGLLNSSMVLTNGPKTNWEERNETTAKAKLSGLISVGVINRHEPCKILGVKNRHELTLSQTVGVANGIATSLLIDGILPDSQRRSWTNRHKQMKENGFSNPEQAHEQKMERPE